MQTQTQNQRRTVHTSRRFSTRQLVMIGVFSAVAFVLQIFEFSLPIAPGFIKFDFSDLPALIITFAYGPLSGILTELIKNLLHLMDTSSMGVGELSNFLLGTALLLPAGLIYQHKKNRRSAAVGLVVGVLVMSLVGIFTNLFFIFPFYTMVMNISMEEIIDMCRTLIPFVDSEWKVILLSVTPFNLLKGLVLSLVTFLAYKPLSPLIKRK